MKSSHQEECLLCCREIFIYATGACDHPVCFECSTRMRVLCVTNECPICRSNMPSVVFTHQLETFYDVSKKFILLNKKYQILFEDEKVRKSFELLLEHKCKLCEEIVPSFNKLKEHVRRKHEFHYCDLCTDNLKIFTFERKCYSRKDLARHKRVGDPDETSHRGHPLCKFCDERFVDSDELFRHLRREHFFCHFCDADGLHQYYGNYDYLKAHFRTDHYLCEEGECVNENFTGAFRSEIDLKAHIALQHSKNKSKAEVKQTRMLEFEFNYVPHTRPTGSSSPRSGRFTQYRKRNVDENNSQDKTRSQQPTEIENINTQSVQEFPYLSDDSVNRKGTNNSTPDTMVLMAYSKNPVSQKKNMSVDDFPVLRSNAAEVPHNLYSKNNFSINKQNNVCSNLIAQTPQKSTFAQNQNVAADNKKSIINNPAQKASKWAGKKSDFNFDEDFPSLEVKMQPKKSALCAPTKPNPVSNSISQKPNPTRLVRDSETDFSDQFVVIKSKSKKKKPYKILPTPDCDDNEDVPSKLQTVSSSFIPSEQENMDPFKRNMVYPTVPITSSRPTYHRVNDIWTQQVAFDNEDFPPLSEPVRKPPPGFGSGKTRAPPPGFGANANETSSTQKRNLTLSAVREIVMPTQNRVKENCLDKSCYIPIQNNYNIYTFIKPPQFEDRNNKLIAKISNLSQARAPPSFQEFKETSGRFRHDAISAAEYHKKCLEILQEDGLLEIFPDLVCLLPDIRKQQELLTVHNSFLSQRSSGAIPKKAVKGNIIECSTCNQVLIDNDKKSHDEYH